MDWVLFSTHCNDPLFFLEALEKNAADLLTQEKKLFILKLFTEAARSMCSKQAAQILPLRQALWVSHFGVPSLDFLLINKQLIQQIVVRVSKAPAADLSDLLSPGFLNYQTLMNKNARKCLYDSYDKPEPDQSGTLIPTMNNQGFMTSRAIDAFTLQFIERAKHSAMHDGRVLEIGAAYGIATLEALAQGATVFCNDLEPAHLAVVEKEHAKRAKGVLVSVPGAFPGELVFEPESFDAILISRVLHFFEGEAVVRALEKARMWLKPGGCLFVINETPFLSNWQLFLGEYEARKKRGEKWPGLIDDPPKYERGTSFVSLLPPLMHFFDQETLEQALLESGFEKEDIQVEYINREGQFPQKLLIPKKQKESVGCKAIKSG